MEGMMERIRVKSDQQKTLLDTAKSLRIAMADKRHSLDSQDKVISWPPSLPWLKRSAASA